MVSKHPQRTGRASFIAAHPLCCYCNGRRETVEIDHAPARICFHGKQAPEGYEFPSCSECNRAVAISEQVAAFYIRSFDLGQPELDEKAYERLISGIVNNAPDALPRQEYTHAPARNYLATGADVAERTVSLPDSARHHIELFGLKVAYALYYRATGRCAGSSNRYLVHWAQIGTEAAEMMAARADAWFDQHVVGRRPNIDLGDQFRYQTGYNPAHGYFGLKMSFSSAFSFFCVIGPARELIKLKPRLPLCPSIYEAGKNLKKRRL